MSGNKKKIKTYDNLSVKAHYANSTGIIGSLVIGFTLFIYYFGLRGTIPSLLEGCFLSGTFMAIIYLLAIIVYSRRIGKK